MSKPIIAVIAPGAMGAAVGRRLASRGADVRTVLSGRSDASRARAASAGMQGVELARLAEADVILSIVPPGEAVALAESLAAVLRQARPATIFADCNAISPQTVGRVEAVIATTGVRFVDAGIIGGPPKPETPGPVFYASGPDAAGLMVLQAHGIRVSVLDGPVGAASGLKMSYGGLTKGLTALGSAMMLAATRFGAAPQLAAELASSQPALLTWLQRSVPDMYPKAYRWVAEMQEVASFAKDGSPETADIYEGIAALYEHLAQDQAGAGHDIDALSAFMALALTKTSKTP